MAVQTISYQDKVALNQNSDIADINKCNASDLNEIKDVVNNNAMETATNTTNITNIINAEVYSTSEVKTNKVSTDNKPIYRKVIIYTTALTANNNIPHGISNLKEITDIWGFVPYSTNFYKIGTFESTTNFIGFSTLSTTYIGLRVGSSWSSSFSNGCKIYIEYTKTTD